MWKSRWINVDNYHFLGSFEPKSMWITDFFHIMAQHYVDK